MNCLQQDVVIESWAERNRQALTRISTPTAPSELHQTLKNYPPHLTLPEDFLRT